MAKADKVEKLSTSEMVSRIYSILRGTSSLGFAKEEGKKKKSGGRVAKKKSGGRVAKKKK